MSRTARVCRKTSETDVTVELNLDGAGRHTLQTQIPFLDHMLAQLATHGLFDLNIEARGDLQVDLHHTVEDVGIALGDAFAQAMGDKRGIRRFASALVPLDEALARVALDISGRPYMVYEAPQLHGRIESFDVALVKEFMRALAMNMKVNLHVGVLYGENLHHCVEAIFKALAKSLDQATAIDPRVAEVPSTKGSL
ncbi:imidazoleglycerol-phosphate dehydratase [Candidatus Methylomirabilis lanthanidiphila]|uniref:Imidazoleglycerol-phosphate dehydratase n=1 Tax=Candidatus Methylomirabilis lanthanidiphila TaxID=2211376 RepID=A0A564ZG59_9BACT|nr:imidazoleglycerol-phosphate dehydratase HisB [Candidatus Methylomirabilis lanthanidiphila]VUZ84116.1 imidazoleglycerol-phosphate dehydratase [Candidatus Methylomirabilis lanthanidiphila]